MTELRPCSQKYHGLIFLTGKRNARRQRTVSSEYSAILSSGCINFQIEGANNENISVDYCDCLYCRAVDYYGCIQADFLTCSGTCGCLKLLSRIAYNGLPTCHFRRFNICTTQRLPAYCTARAVMTCWL